MSKAYKELLKYQRYLNDKAIEVEKANGEIWNLDYWITDLFTEAETEEEARQQLLDKVKDLPGVEIINNKRGVKSIRVKSAYKYYNYDIHAHYASKPIHTGKYEKSLWSDELEEVIEYKPYIYASFSALNYKHQMNWSYRENKEYNIEQFEEEYKHLKELEKKVFPNI